ncbi:hypothetical protein IJT93_00150 [bacterium]|nr:hypothetical protein [bacterium]
MGGYGGTSGRKKERCYYDTGNKKVIDNNAITVAEHYLREGKYVAFLKKLDPIKRPDLSLDHEMIVEVKGVTSLKYDRMRFRIADGFDQIQKEWSMYPKGKRHPGKVIILSLNDNFDESYKAAVKGYRIAKSEGSVHGTVEFWHHGQIYELK